MLLDLLEVMPRGPAAYGNARRSASGSTCLHLELQVGGVEPAAEVDDLDGGRLRARGGRLDEGADGRSHREDAGRVPAADQRRPASAGRLGERKVSEELVVEVARLRGGPLAHGAVVVRALNSYFAAPGLRLLVRPALNVGI